MSLFLKNLLGNDHPLFTANLAQLERATGNAGIDVRLIGDITTQAHAVMRTLGLDPADTTSKELYNALKGAVMRGMTDDLLAETSYVLIDLGAEPISLNKVDVIENAHHELPYQHRQTGHAKRHLRLEILRRYAEHDRTNHDMVYGLMTEADVHQEDDQHAALMSNSAEAKPSILAIGDIFTDAFIKLREDKARVTTDEDGSKWLSVPFGSKPPYERVDIVKAVGPSPNAAVSFSRLGASASLRSFLGNDITAKDTTTYLTQQGVATDLLSIQDGIASNYYYVLRYGAERTILVKNENYDYTWKAPDVEPDWIYLSLISQDAWQLHEDLLSYLEAHPQVKLAFQPGTFHFEWGREKLAAIYERSTIIILNREEAAEVTELPVTSIAALAKSLHALGPKIAVITDGPNGSYASYEDSLIRMPNYPDPAAPVDRTGAGDAFASTIVAALAHGESMDTALMWAATNSMSVVQQLGAQAGLLTRDEIAGYLREAPADFKAEIHND